MLIIYCIKYVSIIVSQKSLEIDIYRLYSCITFYIFQYQLMSTTQKWWMFWTSLLPASAIFWLVSSAVFYIIVVITNDAVSIDAGSTILTVKKVVNWFCWLMTLVWLISFIPWIIMLSKTKNKQQSDTIEIASTEEKNKILPYGWFWVRCVAYIIDELLKYLIIPLFFNVYFYFKDGDSIGYKIMWLKILDATTRERERPDAGQLIWRRFAKILSALPLWLGFFWVGWDEEKQWWHDKLAETIVVQYRKPNRRLASVFIFLFILLVILSSLSK